MLEFTAVVLFFTRCGWSKRHSRVPDQVAGSSVKMRPRMGALLQNLFPRQQDAATSEFSDALHRIHASGMLELPDECDAPQKIRSALRIWWRV